MRAPSLLALRTALGLAVLTAPASAPAQAQERNVACTNGQAGIYACRGVDLMARLPLSTFASPGSPVPSRGNDIWGWTDPQTGREYALMGFTNGTAFVDVTDPAAPVYLGKLPSAVGTSTWRDVKVYANHAFIVADLIGDHGMQVFDLTRLRSVTSPPVTFSADARYTGFGSAHNIVINEATGFAYAVGGSSGGQTCNGGLHMINVQNPLAPTFAGCAGQAGYTHDAQCVVYNGPDAAYAGHEICIAANGRQGDAGAAADRVAFVDVTDKANPVVLGVPFFYPTPGYAHQAWLTEDHRYLLLDDELDESQGIVTTGTRTVVLDVSDLDDPEVVTEYFGPVLTIDHNLYIRGRYAYLSNYESGLRILDLAGIASGALTEAAFFDTYNQGDNVTFNGQWSNYPFFASGNVIAHDRDNGLFVLRPTALATANEAAPGEAGYALSAPVPNPLRDRARLDLRVAAAQRVRAEAFDALGRRVAVVFEGAAAPGAPTPLVFDGSALPAGPYLLRVTGEAFVAAARVTVAH